MTAHFLDTSAWAKLYATEPGSAWMAQWYGRAGVIAVSSLGLVELLSTVARRRAAGALTASRSDAISRKVLEDSRRFAIIHLDVDVFERAVELPARVALRGADTVQLASLLALRAQALSEGEEVVLVSADTDLNAATTAEGILVLDPVAQEAG